MAAMQMGIAGDFPVDGHGSVSQHESGWAGVVTFLPPSPSHTEGARNGRFKAPNSTSAVEIEVLQWGSRISPSGPSVNQSLFI